jgi:hypothetical protein
MMVEVFKTDVNDRDDANRLIKRIHEAFDGYIANFDLEDCDKILRVKCTTGVIVSSCLIDLLKNLGFAAEVLPDEISSAIHHSVRKKKVADNVGSIFSF